MKSFEKNSILKILNFTQDFEIAIKEIFDWMKNEQRKFFESFEENLTIDMTNKSICKIFQVLFEWSFCQCCSKQKEKIVVIDLIIIVASFEKLVDIWKLVKMIWLLMI